MNDKENALNEDGQSSESVTNVLNPGGSQEYDDSSDTSLKLGWVVSETICYLIKNGHLELWILIDLIYYTMGLFVSRFVVPILGPKLVDMLSRPIIQKRG